ncbi:MAG TPA: chromate transporter [Xanthobacteraceae bacterium]|nr:chromate transporter [Xanthobacteraceae bacterium]
MSQDSDIYLTLLANFAIFSLMAVGGANSTVPEMHRQAVEVHQWMGDRTFSELFAIAQAAPGPNVVFVALLGDYVAGVPGALTTIFAMCAPSCAIAYGVARVIDRFEKARWRAVIQAGLVPLTIGLVASSALIVARAADRNAATLLITAASFALCYWTRVTPLLPLGLAAALGFTGLV